MISTALLILPYIVYQPTGHLELPLVGYALAALWLISSIINSHMYVVSGHKMLGCPMPCGVVITRKVALRSGHIHKTTVHARTFNVAIITIINHLATMAFISHIITAVIHLICIMSS